MQVWLRLPILGVGFIQVIYAFLVVVGLLAESCLILSEFQQQNRNYLLLHRCSEYYRFTDLYVAQQPDYVDRAVEHICFLADVNRLYENALGLYDLDLTLLVAQQSQKVISSHNLQNNRT